MGLNWNWNEKCGEITLSQKREDGTWKDFTLSLYIGNAFLIILSEYKDKDTGEDMYNLNSFFTDEKHMKRCFGIDKQYKETYGDNMYVSDWQKWTKVKILKSKFMNYKKFVAAVAEAFDEIDIEIVSEL